jgi:hypothetical protein
MNQPHDDKELARFLRENRPDVPDAPANLEDKILAATALPPRATSIRAALMKRTWIVGLVALPIAAAILLSLQHHNEKIIIASITPTATLAEENGLSDEAAWEFLEESWSGVQNQSDIVQVADALDTL